LKITILSDAGSWKNAALREFAARLRRRGHRVAHFHDEKKVGRGDILFILGFFKIVPPAKIAGHRISVVVHESRLPKGRGWSPVTWLVWKGARSIPLTLFEAVQKVDAGRIFLRGDVPLNGSELLDEIHAKVAPAIVRLCERFVARYPGILKRGIPQTGKPTYYRRLAPPDSRLDPDQPIASQFNRLRCVDNKDYPAFFSYKGKRYSLKIEKMEK